MHVLGKGNEEPWVVQVDALRDVHYVSQAYHGWTYVKPTADGHDFVRRLELRTWEIKRLLVYV